MWELFQGNSLSSPPLWFMRQAGRYLPEYRKIRETCPTFLELCYTPELATRVTLQPIERFDFDAAIIFSDILVIPQGLGQHLSFESGKGPQLEPLNLSFFQTKLSFAGFLSQMAPVYEAIRLTRAQLSPSKALIGFSGAPWTLALYMLEGEGSRDFAKAKQIAFQNEKLFSSFLDFLVSAISLHLIEQIKAGASALQIFDSWAGLCPSSHFQKWIIEPTRRIVSSVRDVFPEIPLIGFPKGCGANLIDYSSHCDFSGISLDSSTPLSWAVKNLSSDLILQGNLDPLLLCAGGEPLKNAIISIHQHMNGRPYIFNLGHGIVPQTPIKNVEDCIKWVRELR
ncbi:MAG: uroporphyrinogen decarboxylase [Alphaproteobacteria bacterium]|nr:uroporphyrinogen decarboxylase [Alphaproteobacteria bacterium]